MRHESIRKLYDQKLSEFQVELLAMIKEERPEVAQLIDPALNDLPTKGSELIEIAIKHLGALEIPTEDKQVLVTLPRRRSHSEYEG